MLEKVKLVLRIMSDDFNEEIEDLIASARQDLILSGISSDLVSADDEVDPLIERAIKTYCKAHFGYDNPDADRLNHSYQMLKHHLTLAGDYLA